MSNVIRTLNQNLQGFYKLAIVNPTTQEVVWEQDDWGKNLILNNGMDHIYSDSIVGQMTYGISGDGTRVNQKDSGISTITQSGANVYLYNNSGDITDFTAPLDTYAATVQVGDMLKYANNSESKVTSVVGARNLQVTPSYTFGAGDAQQFVVWKTSQTALEQEISRSANYVVASGYCGTTTVGNVKTHRRSYDFPVEGTTTGYNEIGVGWASSGANTTFSRILLPSTIIVPTAFQLRLIYELQCTFTPAISQSKSFTVGGGWGLLNGSESIQTFLTSIVNTNGTSDTSTAVLDPYWVNTGGDQLSVFTSAESASLAAFGSAVNRHTTGVGYSTAVVSKTGQVIGTYSVDKTGTIPTSNGNSSNIRALGLGRYNGSVFPAQAAQQGFCYVFDTNQTKFNTQTVSLTFRWTWARVLA